eukprot:6213011-Pleurochrysis_carterae.AAC.1
MINRRYSNCADENVSPADKMYSREILMKNSNDDRSAKCKILTFKSVAAGHLSSPGAWRRPYLSHPALRAISRPLTPRAVQPSHYPAPRTIFRRLAPCAVQSSHHPETRAISRRLGPCPVLLS